MLFIIIYNSMYNMLFNYTPCVLHSLWYFPPISLLSPPFDLSRSLSPSQSLSAFSPGLSLISREIRESGERTGGDLGGDWRMREKREIGRESLHVLGYGEPPLGYDTSENHQRSASFTFDRREVCLLLSSQRSARRRLRGCREDDERANMRVFLP